MAAFLISKDAPVMELVIKLEDVSSIGLSGVHSVETALLANHVI